MKIKAGFHENDIFYVVNILLLVTSASTQSIKIVSIKADGGTVDAMWVVN